MRKKIHGGLIRRTWLAVLFCCAAAFPGPAAAADDGNEAICAVYISGIGCSNCAVTDPVIFTQWTQKYPRLILFEYEIYKHLADNREVKDDYFKIYLEGHMSGVPFVLFNGQEKAIGRTNVLKKEEALPTFRHGNLFPSRYGFGIAFNELDIPGLPGRPNIWTKNRVLMPVKGMGGDNALLKKILVAKDMAEALQGVAYEKVNPRPVLISKGKLNFQHAAKIGNWLVQWNGESAVMPVPEPDGGLARQNRRLLTWMLALLVLMGTSFLFLNRKRKIQKGQALRTDWSTRLRDILVTGFIVLALTTFYLLAKNVSPDYLARTGYQLPLPLFTLLIGIVDGFNPCNMFVLTCMLALLVATSHARLKLYVVSLCFVAVVYVFYFSFMAAWLNVFKYIGFVRPLSIGLGIIAVIAGLINCKELFFFKKGVSLTISDKHKGPLMRRMDRVKEAIQNGSFPVLISSSIALAVLSSLVELPCTAGFPIIYTGVLTGRGLGKTWMYYAYLSLYNLYYVVPLLVIISAFIYTLRARQLTQRQVEIMKFVGGVIMLLLGIILLVNPGLIGIGIGSR